VHGHAIQAAARELIALGITDSEVARRLGVPRTTVRDWRAPRYAGAPRDVCWRCWRLTRPVRFEPADYTELLGLYLGDGHITALARTERLRIFLDARHETIVDEADALLRRCFPNNRVARVVRARERMVILSLHNGHLSCLFPQHGPGKKHDRQIVLEPWQEALVDAAPWSLLKGLIRSDGCAYINRTGKYEYLSYCFDNQSREIRALFVEACGRVGVECRASGTSIRIYRRASVALMLDHVGIKN
jgi:hypothetical protein